MSPLLWFGGLVAANLLLYGVWYDLFRSRQRSVELEDRLAEQARDKQRAHCEQQLTVRRLRDDRAQFEGAMRAALDEERRGLEADLQWAAVEADWHAFVGQWPTLDEAR